MAKTKITVLIDEELLRRFKELMISKHGSSRMLSFELEEAIRAFSPRDVIRSLAARLGLDVSHYPSLDEVSRNRPRVSVSAGETIRKLRDERAKRLLGLQ